MPIPKSLERIFDDLRHSDRSDHKVYVSGDSIVWLADEGGEVTANHKQVSGSWLTEIKVGKILFTHSSKRQLVS